MTGLVGGDRNELARHQTPLVRVQIKRATLDRFDPHRPALNQIQQLFQLTRTPIQPVQMPRDHSRDTGRDVTEHRLILRTPGTIEGGNIVVDEHINDVQPQPGSESLTIFPLPTNTRLTTRAIIRDPQIDHCQICHRSSYADGFETIHRLSTTGLNGPGHKDSTRSGTVSDRPGPVCAARAFAAHTGED